VGAPVDVAVATVESERPDLARVQTVAAGAAVTSDISAGRVRVYFNPRTRRVTAPPRVG